MRVHVALTPADSGPCGLEGHAVLVVDVLRATTTVIAACAAGCRRVIPVTDERAAIAAAACFPRGEVLLAGERDGDPILGFDLGNSPLEYTADRVGGRTIILTTTNGSAAMTRARRARAGAAAALANVGAAAAWALGQGAELTVLCSGDEGALSLEDAVCAGLLVERMLAHAPDLRLSAGADLALHLGAYYSGRLGDVRTHSRWGRRLAAKGRSADLDACLSVDTTAMVPVLEAGVIVPGRAAGASPADARRGAGAEAGP
jgi:2-phosphosulfolactate phosphatase